MSFKIQIKPSGIQYLSGENLLEDALAQSIPLEHSCKTGDCGMCRAELVSGIVENENGELLEHGSVLTCQSKAMSDVTLIVNYYPELASIKRLTVPSKVSSIDYVTDDIVVLSFRLPPTSAFNYLPGQYINLSFQGIKRSYSIANAAGQEKKIELHIRKVPDGRMSQMLFGQVAENQLMRMEGPHGTFFVREGVKPLVFVATGTGIAPVKSMVEQLIERQDQRTIYIYWGMRYQCEIYCQELVKLAEKYSHVKFTSVLSQERHPNSQHGYVQNQVLQDFDSLAGVEVYACGSVKMIAEAKALFIERGLPSESFYSDAFTAAQ